MRHGIDQGTSLFVPSVLELQMCGRISCPVMGSYPVRVELACWRMLALWLEQSQFRTSLLEKTAASGMDLDNRLDYNRPIGCDNLNLKCKASSNAGFMDIRDRLGIVGHAPHTVATTRRGMRPGVSLVVSPTLYAWGKAAETLWIARP